MPTPLRADAERNRQAIICAAGAVFSVEGTGVTLEHIAKAAGVGVGTIYRRFPTIDDLVAVVLEEKMILYADRAEAAAARADTQPQEAFRDYVLYVLEQQATDIAFSDVLLSPKGGTEQFKKQTRRALKASLSLVDRAKASGAIRHDFEHSDLLLLMHANAGLVKGTRTSAPDAWRRFAQFVLQAWQRDGDDAPLVPVSTVHARLERRSRD